MAKKRRKKAAAKSKPAAKRVAKKRKKKRTAKQQAASRRNIKKARAALGQNTRRKTKRKATKKRKSPKRVAAGKKAAAAKRRYARQRSAYAPALSPALAAQQLAHRLQAKRENRALARMKRDLLKGARKTKAKPRALTLAQKADLALLALNARTTKQRSALKGIVKASAMDTPNQLRLFRKLTGTENPRRRRKRRNPELYANPRRRSRTRARRRNPGLALQWWIADLYKGGRKQTFIDAATKLQAEYSARQLAARNPGASVELSGPYATQPTASTARR